MHVILLTRYRGCLEIEGCYLYFETKVGWRSQYVGETHCARWRHLYFIDTTTLFFRADMCMVTSTCERIFSQLAALGNDGTSWRSSCPWRRRFLPKENLDLGHHALNSIDYISPQGRSTPVVLWDLMSWRNAMQLNASRNDRRGKLVFYMPTVTVSSYAHEIMTAEYGCGLDQILRWSLARWPELLTGLRISNGSTPLTYHFSLSDLQATANELKNVGLPMMMYLFVWDRLRSTRQKALTL